LTTKNANAATAASLTGTPRSNTLARVLTALVLIPLVLVLVVWAPRWLFSAVVTLVAVAALREYLALAAQSGLGPLAWFSYAATAVLVFWAPLAESPALLVLMALALAARPVRSLEKALPGAAASVMGVLYVGLPLAMLSDLRRLFDGPRWVIYVLALTWVSDTAAYFGGRIFGRHKLAPRISPGKTWEGAVASLAASLAFGMAYLAWMRPEMGLAWSGSISAAVNIAGQAGDLAESAIKRGAGAKDSGSILPGHGGLLDRIDALLFAVPALWYILNLRVSWLLSPF
jgi:phosphatidate cytidylyltransferase